MNIRTGQFFAILATASGRLPVLPSESASAEDKERAGMLFMHQAAYDDAITAFSHALKSDPHNARLFEQRGRAFLMQGKKALAMQDFISARELRAPK